MARGNDERHNENRRPKVPDFIPEHIVDEQHQAMNKEAGLGAFGNKKFCTNCGDEWSTIGGDDGLCPDCFQTYHGLGDNNG